MEKKTGLKGKSLLFVVVVLMLTMKTESKFDYKVTSVNRTTSSYRMQLAYTGGNDYFIKPTSPIIKELIFEIRCLSIDDFDIKITDPNKKRFEVPQGGDFPTDPLAGSSFPIALASFNFQYTVEPFDFKITRKANGDILFSTYESRFIYSDKYLEITAHVSSKGLFGLGQRFTSSFEKGTGTWSIFNRDRGQVIDKGTGLQTYGSYPFYLAREVNGFYHINYLRNSNAMDVIVQKNTNVAYVTFKTIGGIFDFRFIIGERTPQETILKLHVYLGRSAIPPFWSLGFHQCRWGYTNVSALENVLSNYQQNNLPLDTIWSDIDYMIDFEDFTIDESRFPLNRMKAITDKYRYVPIIDAGIKVTGKAYDEGVKQNLFIKDASGRELRGKVWPGTTTFVDFFHPNASSYWVQMLDTLYSKVQFSGIWLDMNQYANFCDGPCSPPGDKGFDYSNDLPYNPGSDGIESHTIPLNSTHYGNLLEADVHNFAGMLESASTARFLKSKGQTHPFILSRSSAMGSNTFAFHWTGDNYADFSYLKGSLSDNFNAQLWGIQMVGPDICGFGGDTDEELCARWYQMAAAYPFARSHNAIGAKDQEPYALGPIVLQAAQNALHLRYSLLKEYYTMFIFRRGYGTLFKPVSFVFPNEARAWDADIQDTLFMLGVNILGAPVLERGATSRLVTFIGTNWYNLYSGKYHRAGETSIEPNQLTDPILMYVREGAGILLQNGNAVTSSKDLKNIFYGLGCFRYDPRRSNTTVRIYESIGESLSIQDYNDGTKVSDCIQNGCQYTFNMVLNVTASRISLEVDTVFTGSARLIETLIVTKIYAYFEGRVAVSSLVNPIEIRGNGRTTIPMYQATSGIGKEFGLDDIMIE